MISYQEMRARIFVDCPPERREELAQLMQRRPFAVTNLVAQGLRAEGGGRIGGIYDRDSDQIYLDCNLLPSCNALGLYLHETVHAGDWTGGVCMPYHDTRFCRLIDDVFARYGLVQTAAGRDYCTRDLPERLEERSASAFSLTAIAVLFGGSMYAKATGMVDTVGFFVMLGAAFLAVVIEKIRQSRA